MPTHEERCPKVGALPKHVFRRERPLTFKTLLAPLAPDMNIQYHRQQFWMIGDVIRSREMPLIV